MFLFVFFKISILFLFSSLSDSISSRAETISLFIFVLFSLSSAMLDKSFEFSFNNDWLIALYSSTFWLRSCVDASRMLSLLLISFENFILFSRLEISSFKEFISFRLSLFNLFAFILRTSLSFAKISDLFFSC